MPTTSRRTLISALSALGLAAAVLGSLGAAGQVALAQDQVRGTAVALVEGIPGPDTGPPCPLDKRYVDEQPEGLRPDVSSAWQRLVAKAGQQGVHLCVHDGKRSAQQQQREFDDATRRFGTPELASRYVLSPDRSMHVKGIAVDVQPLASAGWVERNGAPLGWCRRYQNEAWHFEYDPAYATSGCPALLPSATGS